MFDKTRRRIVFTVVSSLLILMTVTLATIYLSNRGALQSMNEEMLRTYAARYSPNGAPALPAGEKPADLPDFKPEGRGEKPGGRIGEPGRNDPRFQLSTFYAVAYGVDGEVLAVNNGNSQLQSEESLLKIASAILKDGRTSGRTGNMTYLVDARDGYTLVAMIDSTINNNNQTLLIRQMLIIGGAALAVLAVISVFLARRIVRPLEENDRRQKRFVSDAGHELKTPIAVISTNSELLKRAIGQSEWLSNIDYENERMSDLVKELLALSKAENGETPKAPLDFSKLVGGEVLPFESLAFEQGKSITSGIEPDLYVRGDPTGLCKLVSILLDNALSHGTGKTVELTLRRDRHSALLTVSNDAPHMSAEQLDRLFERFYRTDASRGDEGSHYGLGLSIAKAVTETHGGQIRAAYKDGKAVFTVSLPLTK